MFQVIIGLNEGNMFIAVTVKIVLGKSAFLKNSICPVTLVTGSQLVSHRANI